MKLLVTLLALFPAAALAQWRAQDVSVLLPLPAPSTMGQALHPATSGEKGALIPAAISAKLPNLVASQSRENTFGNELTVVGFRIDPCFVEGTAPCRRQVRLIWQPVIFQPEAKVRDAAVHSFYDFDPAEWNEFLLAYSALAQSAPAAPQGFVAPALLAQGYNGPYWNHLRTLLLKFCGEKNLTRTTMMTLDFNEHQWVFRGFDIVDGKLQVIRIPRANQPAQTISMMKVGAPEFRASIFPNTFSETGLWLYDDSESNRARFSDAQLNSFVKESLRNEDPSLENTGTVDCVSCHLAQATGDWAQRIFPQWDWATLFGASASSTDSGPTSRLRAFGYNGAKPSASRRLVNETAAVLEKLNGL